MQLKRPGTFVLFIFFAFQIGIAQQSFDSLGIKHARHFFNTVLSLDFYRKPQRQFTTQQAGANVLGTYGVRQANLFFYTPLQTQIKVLADSVQQNTHLLLTASLISLRPVFRDLKQHHLMKAGIGLRYIYNTGKKGVWFFDLSPFVTQDVNFSSSINFRLASSFIYSHNPSVNFNWRLGITKSFQWGNRLYLPFVGLRFGRLDKINLSIQFPRYTSLTIPLNDKVVISIYSMAQGGLYNFANVDGIDLRQKEKTVQFSRYEINHGIRFEHCGSDNFRFYVAAGISNRNVISFYSEGANLKRRSLNYTNYFFRTKAVPSFYLNLGCVFKFGTVKSSWQNKNLMDAADLLNAGAQQHMTPGLQNKLNLKDVQDLVDYSDF